VENHSAIYFPRLSRDSTVTSQLRRSGRSERRVADARLRWPQWTSKAISFSGLVLPWLRIKKSLSNIRFQIGGESTGDLSPAHADYLDVATTRGGAF